MRALLVVLFLALTASAQTPGLSTVRIYTYKVDGAVVPSGYGSGWLIEDDKVVTAAHVVKDHREGNEPVKVRFIDNWKTWATVLAVDEEFDIALLWINKHKTITKLTLRDTPKFGEVSVHGFGYDFEYRKRSGFIAGGMSVVGMNEDGGLPTEPDPNGKWRAVLCCALPGDSGGPLTMHGQVFGSVLAANNKYCIICPIEIIREKFSGHLTPRKQP